MAAALRRNLAALQPALGKAHFPQSSQTRRLTRTSECHQDNTSWFGKQMRKIEPTKESHSRMLSDKNVIYALHTHNIRPDSYDKYYANYNENVQYLQDRKKELNLELVGSWNVEVGDLDQALHLWQYHGGFQSVDGAQAILAKDESYQKLLKDRGMYLRSRHLQYCFAFSYWPSIELRDGNNRYEIRSYQLKPGTMIEWGNNWARAINFRRNNNEAFAGIFSQVGRLYNVHHLWCYKDLQTRKETREAAWRSPGWDECVSYTVPLIRETHSRILNPMDFSPTK